MGSMKERDNNRNDLDDAFFAKHGKILTAY
jgi:hypothetical protein